MATSTNNFILLSTLLLIIAITPYIEASETEKKTQVVVESMVYCQSCEHLGTWSLNEAKPIPSAKVSVTCKNHINQVSYYKVFDTDKNGYLYAELEGLKVQNYIVDHPLHSCYAKLVWSPIESCSILSNVNYDALNGAPLRYQNKRLHGSNFEAVIYSAGPLAFRPNHCSHTTTP